MMLLSIVTIWRFKHQTISVVCRDNGLLRLQGFLSYPIKLDYSLRTLHHNLIELGHFFDGYRPSEF